MIALLDAYRAGLLKPKQWWTNIVAGLIVGVVALPLSMAFAIASGAKPEQGLYTAIIAGFIVGVFGGSRVQIAGPTGAFVVILASITYKYGIDGLQIATLMAGFILVLMGLLRLGSVIKFIPEPVIVGFTSGIGFVIFVGQWSYFFGLHTKIAIDAHFHEKLFALLMAFPHLTPTTALLGLVSLGLMLVTPKVTTRIPPPLVAMVVVTAVQTLFQFNGVATLGSTFGAIPQHLPAFYWPELSTARLWELTGPAITIALLGAIESLLSATAADRMAQTRHHSNQELIGQGLANIIAPLFGGFAATGAIARTATNVRSGGNSPIAAVVHSAILVLILVSLAPLAAYVPLCTLAAILFVVSYKMSDIPRFIYIVKRAPKADRAVLLATFALTIFTDLVFAVNVGVVLAMIFFIRRMSQMVQVQKQVVADQPADTVIYSIEGPVFFGAAEKIEKALETLHSHPKTIIFRLKHVPFMDMTGLQAFLDMMKQEKIRGVTVFLCEANTAVATKLFKVGLENYLETEKIYADLAEVLAQIRTHPVVVRTKAA